MMLALVVSPSVAQAGIGMGTAMALVLSWHRIRSIFWMLVAGLFSWLYVLHFALTRQADERR